MHQGQLYLISDNMKAVDSAMYQKDTSQALYCLVINREDFLAHQNDIEKAFNIQINSHHVKDIQNKEHPSFFDSTSEYEMVILRTIHSIAPSNEAKPSLRFLTSSYVFFCFHELLIIIHDNEASLFDRFDNQIIKNRKNLYKNPLELLYFSLSFLLDQFLLLRAPISKQFKQWQNLMLNEETQFKQWNELINYKSEIEGIMDLSEDIEDTLEDWRRYTRYQLEQEFIINLNDLDEHNQRALHIIEKMSSNIDTLIQLHFSALSHRNNEILRVLAIISAIFLPLTLITGIFGMNFNHMPILGERYAYYLTIATMIGLAIVLISFFKLKKWI